MSGHDERVIRAQIRGPHRGGRHRYSLAEFEALPAIKHGGSIYRGSWREISPTTGRWEVWHRDYSCGYCVETVDHPVIVVQADSSPVVTAS